MNDLNMPPITDLSARVEALDPELSIICEAPAGSGKTELLTQRFLVLLARVKKPEEIIAITFTRKAAGEMRERILHALRLAIEPSPPAMPHQKTTWELARKVGALDREYAWQLIDNPNRLQIKTFDSLCASLANSLPMMSSFAAPPSVSENVQDIYQAAVKSLFETIEDDVPWCEALTQVFRLLDNNTQKLERLFVRMLAQREAWLSLIGSGASEDEVIALLERNLERTRGDTIAKARALIPSQYQSHLVKMAAFAASHLQGLSKPHPLQACLNLDLEGDALPDADGAGVESWLGCIAMCLTDKGEWRKTLDKRVGFPAGDNKDEKAAFKENKQRCLSLLGNLAEIAGLREMFLDIRHLPANHFQTNQSVLLSAVVRVLPILSAYLTLAFREKNSVDFSEISIKAREALGGLASPSDLALALDHKIQHILVDEFQDTSPAQIELLTLLTAGWEAGDGRTLFCVGDAMQSIYGFRGANVGLFIHCLEHGLGHVPLKPLRLTTNFRSQSGLVEWVNRTFAQAFPARSDISDGAVTYADSVAFQPASDGVAVSIHGANEGAYGEEAGQVLELIKSARVDMPEGTIAILVRNRNHARVIADTLSRSGIVYRAVDLEPLIDTAVVQDLMALTHGLMRPADRIAWFSILRAPWCGLSLSDLDIIARSDTVDGAHATVFEQIKGALNTYRVSQQSAAELAGEDGFQSDLFSANENTPGHLLSDDAVCRLTRILPVLNESVSQIFRKPLRQWVEGTWLALGGLACLNSQQERNNARVYFSLLDGLDTGALLPQRTTLDTAVEKLFATPDPASDGALQIMTIHKSKGLEFDTVIIPGLHRQPRNIEPELLQWYERLNSDGQQQLIMSPLSSSGSTKDSVYQHLAAQRRKKELNESCRLLYVACTRARKRLHLLTEIKRDLKRVGEYKPPAVSSLLHPIWSSVKMHIILNEADAHANQADQETTFSGEISRLPVNWHNVPRLHGELLKEYIPFFSHNNQQAPSLAWTDPSPRYIGTLIHRIMQEIGEQGLSKWQQQDLVARQAVWRRRLIALGIPRQSLKATVDKVAAIVRSLVSDKNVQWMLGEPHQQRIAEYPVSVEIDGKVQQLIIDLLLCDNDDTWIIDYKFSLPVDTESLEHFLAREQSTYREAMLRYRQSIVGLGYRQVKMALYFPLIAQWLVIT